MNENQTQIIDTIIKTRRSCRAFLPDPVSESVLRDILNVAQWAPSGSNSQPWQVHAVMGALLKQLGHELAATDDIPNEASKHTQEYAYYPKEWRSPYIERRRRNGFTLYDTLGIVKGDKAAMHKQHNLNYTFFGAPVCLVFTIDKDLNQGSWLDYGFFLQNVLLATEARGLATCTQVSLNKYHKIFRKYLSLPDNQTMVCGVALGTADKSAIVNSFMTERENLEAFVTFHKESV